MGDYLPGYVYLPGSPQVFINKQLVERGCAH